MCNIESYIQENRGPESNYMVITDYIGRVTTLRSILNNTLSDLEKKVQADTRHLFDSTSYVEYWGEWMVYNPEDLRIILHNFREIFNLKILSDKKEFLKRWNYLYRNCTSDEFVYDAFYFLLPYVFKLLIDCIKDSDMKNQVLRDILKPIQNEHNDWQEEYHVTRYLTHFVPYFVYLKKFPNYEIQAKKIIEAIEQNTSEMNK